MSLETKLLQNTSYLGKVRKGKKWVRNDKEEWYWSVSTIATASVSMFE